MKAGEYIQYLPWKFGFIKIIANSEVLKRLEFISDSEKSENKNRITEIAEAELSKYLKGELQEFTVKIAPDGTDFQKTVWHHLCTISYGKTASYSGLTAVMGDMKKIRAVANANGQNPIPIIIPCHRVIGKDGSLTGYSGGLHIKKFLIELENKMNQFELFG